MKNILKLYRLLGIGIIAILLLNSCQDVIELDLKESERRYVIEANIDAGLGRIEVLISKSGSFYQETDFDRISGATVRLNIGGNQTYLLSETQPGTYAWDTVVIQPGDAAFLTVTLQGGEQYEATTICPIATALDSLEVNPLVAPFSTDTVYQLLYNFQDPVGISSYYRLKVRQNGALLDGYVVYNDDGQDGEYIKIPYFGPPFDATDTLEVTFYTTDKEYHDYFVKVSDASSAGLGSSVPYNPKGNFTPEVLGYFGIWYKSELSIIIPR